MSQWIDVKTQKPPRAERPEQSDPDMDYTWSTTVKILLSADDRFGLSIYPSGECEAYYDFDDAVWYWRELSGGPNLAPTHWMPI